MPQKQKKEMLDGLDTLAQAANIAQTETNGITWTTRIGQLESLLRLGLCEYECVIRTDTLRDKGGVNQDALFKQAIEHIRQSAEGGYADAQYILAEIVYNSTRGLSGTSDDEDRYIIPHSDRLARLAYNNPAIPLPEGYLDFATTVGWIVVPLLQKAISQGHKKAGEQLEEIKKITLTVGQNKYSYYTWCQPPKLPNPLWVNAAFTALAVVSWLLRGVFKIIGNILKG